MTIRLGDILSVLAIIVALAAVYNTTHQTDNTVRPYHINVITKDAVSTEVFVVTGPLDEQRQLYMREYVRRNVVEYTMETLVKDPIARTNLERHIASDLSGFDINIDSVWFKYIDVEMR